jgi:hypothetical protein
MAAAPSRGTKSQPSQLLVVYSNAGLGEGARSGSSVVLAEKITSYLSHWMIAMGYLDYREGLEPVIFPKGALNEFSSPIAIRRVSGKTGGGTDYFAYLIYLVSISR